MFIDLLIFLNSIRSFPDASEALENQVNADVGEVCYLCLFYDALKYLSTFWNHAHAIKCPEKANFRFI